MVTELRTAQRLILKWFEAGIDFLMHNSGCMRAAMRRLCQRSFFRVSPKLSPTAEAFGEGHSGGTWFFACLERQSKD